MTRGKVRCPIGVGHDGNMKGMTEKKVGQDGNVKGMTMRRSGMTEEKEVHGTISSLPGAIVIAGLTGNLLTGNLRCPIGVGHDNETVGHDEERGSGMTEEEGQDGGEKGFPERGAFGEWGRGYNFYDIS